MAAIIHYISKIIRDIKFFAAEKQNVVKETGLGTKKLKEKTDYREKNLLKIRQTQTQKQ